MPQQTGKKERKFSSWPCFSKQPHTPKKTAKCLKIAWDDTLEKGEHVLLRSEWIKVLNTHQAPLLWNVSQTWPRRSAWRPGEKKKGFCRTLQQRTERGTEWPTQMCHCMESSLRKVIKCIAINLKKKNGFFPNGTMKFETESRESLKGIFFLLTKLIRTD